MNDTLDDDHPLWLVNEQIKGLLEGDGASEDHEEVISFLKATGLPDGTVFRIHMALVNSENPRVKTFDQWHKEHAKYMEPADIVHWCREAWEASRAALPKPKPVAWTTKGQIAAMENGFQHYIQGRVPRFVQPCTDDVPLYTTPPQPDDVRDAERYRELIMAVERKFPNESRHETALRYIKAGERKTKVVDAGMAKVALRQAKGD